MKLNIQNAVNNAKLPRSKKEEEVIRIFDKYVASTLAKLDRSIADARGRYEEGKTYSVAKPSLNWKVVGKADSLETETALVWLKVGIEKIVIGDIYNPDTGKLVKENAKEVPVKFAQANLIPALEEMRSNIESIRDDRESQDSKDFWEIAIKQAMPKTQPKDGGVWDYDGATDTYIVKK
jgi:predicted kinase